MRAPKGLSRCCLMPRAESIRAAAEALVAINYRNHETAELEELLQVGREYQDRPEAIALQAALRKEVARRKEPRMTSEEQTKERAVLDRRQAEHATAKSTAWAKSPAGTLYSQVDVNGFDDVIHNEANRKGKR